MATLFFSGLDRPERLSLLVAEGAAGMINANNALQPKLRQAYSCELPIPLVLDSPAFLQLKWDVVKYADIIEEVGHHFLWISNLDVIGNQTASDRNFEYLQSHLSPHLRNKILWIYQGGSLDELENVAQQRRFVGIGGLVSLLRRQGSEAVQRYLAPIGERLLRVQARAHVFGMGGYRLLFFIRGEPWLASTDSSKWLVAYKASEVLRVDGANQAPISQLGLLLTAQERAANNIRVMHLWIMAHTTVQFSLPFSEEIEASLYYEDPSTLTRILVLLEGISDDEAFLESFLSWIAGIDSGTEENEVIYMLHASSSLNLEEDLLIWCVEAASTNTIASYYIWTEPLGTSS